MVWKLQLLFMFLFQANQMEPEQPITVLIFNSQKVDNPCYVVVSECSDIRETAKRPGLAENVKVQLNR